MKTGRRRIIGDKSPFELGEKVTTSYLDDDGASLESTKIRTVTKVTPLQDCQTGWMVQATGTPELDSAWFQPAADPCPFCNKTHPGVCPRIKSVEFDFSGGQQKIRKIEFHDQTEAS